MGYSNKKRIVATDPHKDAKILRLINSVFSLWDKQKPQKSDNMPTIE